jgi:hypothetical protein
MGGGQQQRAAREKEVDVKGSVGSGAAGSEMAVHESCERGWGGRVTSR